MADEKPITEVVLAEGSIDTVGAGYKGLVRIYVHSEFYCPDLYVELLSGKNTQKGLHLNEKFGRAVLALMYYRGVLPQGLLKLHGAESGVQSENMVVYEAIIDARKKIDVLCDIAVAAGCIDLRAKEDAEARADWATKIASAKSRADWTKLACEAIGRNNKAANEKTIELAKRALMEWDKDELVDELINVLPGHTPVCKSLAKHAKAACVHLVSNIELKQIAAMRFQD